MLDQGLVQIGSEQDGTKPPVEGLTASATSNNNFINFCQNKGMLTNGIQVTSGSCNGVVMGSIPPADRMISTVIISPENNADVQPNTDFHVQVQVQNLVAGIATNAQSTFYAAPQTLNGAGLVAGHVHVVIQDLGGTLNPTTPLNPATFAFFQEIKDAGNGRGLLSTQVIGGLPAGNYRLCTMTVASNHQPVLMPVAPRGAQDDCIRFTVGRRDSALIKKATRH